MFFPAEPQQGSSERRIRAGTSSLFWPVGATEADTVTPLEHPPPAILADLADSHISSAYTPSTTDSTPQRPG